MSKHLPEPWSIPAHAPCQVVKWEDKGSVLSAIKIAECKDFEHAARIMTCVNFLAGIPTEVLDQGLRSEVSPGLTLLNYAQAESGGPSFMRDGKRVSYAEAERIWAENYKKHLEAGGKTPDLIPHPDSSSFLGEVVGDE